MSKFVFFPSRYSQAHKIDLRKKDRYIRIAHEALEQCGRADEISLEWYETLIDACRSTSGGTLSLVASTLHAPSIASQSFAPGASYVVYV